MKALLQTTNLRRLNIIVYSLIVVLNVVFFTELEWSFDKLSGYLSDKVTISGKELDLLKSAQAALKYDDAVQGQALLKQSLAIDPNSAQAHYMLGSILYQTGESAQALQEFTTTLKIDPSWHRSYLAMAHIYWDKNQPEKAMNSLTSGINFFQTAAMQHQPQNINEVPQRYNDKAISNHRYYLEALNLLNLKRMELESVINK